MNISPTLDGGMRIDLESADDWSILRFLPYDASHGEQDLATRLGPPGTDKDLREDWELYVEDDLRALFLGQVATVSHAIETAEKAADGGTGQLTIAREAVDTWFGTLNQARLALESHYQFHGPAQAESTERAFAFQRSQFYTAIQGLLLDRSMRP